jgi:GrpB protein
VSNWRASPPTPTPPEALEQLRLRYRLAAAAADGYFEAGFSVALEDVVAGPILGDYRTMIRSRPCHLIVLLPTVEAVTAREAEREHKGYGAWTIEQLYDGFVSGTPRVGLWLDTTYLTADETVEEILAETSSTRSPIIVTDYDAEWPLHFEEIAQPVRDAVADLGAMVEHVGSTSVSGLAAKPIIDIDVVVGSADDVPAAIERLRSLGYLYQGDKGIKRPRSVYVAERRETAPPLRGRARKPALPRPRRVPQLPSQPSQGRPRIRRSEKQARRASR